MCWAGVVGVGWGGGTMLDKRWRGHSVQRGDMMGARCLECQDGGGEYC